MSARVLLRDGAVVGFVGRSARLLACGCGRTATRACDGRVPSARGSRRRCGAPVCDGCARPVDDTRDLCADCVRAAAPAPAPEGALVAYTDGSGTIATKPCGAGVVVFDGDVVVVEAAWHVGLGSNNVAELSAVRLALWITARLDRTRLAVIRTDSTYTIESLTGAPPHPLAANAGLIDTIRRRLEGRRVQFEHVRGHAGIFGNERADALANRGRLAAPKGACA